MQPFLHFYDGFKNMPENRKQNVSSYTNAPIAQLDGVHDTCSESDFTFDANDEEVFPSIGNRQSLFESLPHGKSSVLPLHPLSSTIAKHPPAARYAPYILNKDKQMHKLDRDSNISDLLHLPYQMN